MKRIVLISLSVLFVLPVGAWAARDRIENEPASIGLVVTVDPRISDEITPVIQRALHRYISYRLNQTGHAPGTPGLALDRTLSISLGLSSPAGSQGTVSAKESACRTLDAPVDELVVRAVLTDAGRSDTVTITRDSLHSNHPDPAGLLPESALFLMRACDAIANGLPQLTPVTAETAQDGIPIQVYVDSSFRSRYPRSWDRRIDELIRMTSQSLQGQLGMGLDLQYTMLVEVGGKRGMNLLEAHYALHAQEPMSPDMLVIGVYGTPAESQIGGRPRLGMDQIGYATIQKRRVTISDIDLPEDLDHWWGLVMARVLAHEVYHALGGAVHVWDVEAIMNPLFAWPLSDSLDPVNRKLVRDVVTGHRSAGSKAQYAQRVVDAVGGRLSSSLIDWPQFAYDFTDVLAGKMKTPELDSLTRHDLMSAALGVELLKSTDSRSRARATNIFASLSERYPGEGAFWYWLWRSAEGAQADTALAKAGRLGYYPAQMELEKGIDK